MILIKTIIKNIFSFVIFIISLKLISLIIFRFGLLPSNRIGHFSVDTHNYIVKYIKSKIQQSN